MSKPIFMRRPTHDRTLDVWMSLVEERVPVMDRPARRVRSAVYLFFFGVGMDKESSTSGQGCCCSINVDI